MTVRAVGGRSAVLNVMTKAVYKAARRLVRDFGEVEQLQVSKKGPGDFVSTADHQAEKTLYEELLKARPAFGFLLEESGEIKGEDPSHRWIVDPLDGTTNFLHGLPHFSISVGLEHNGECIAGVVYQPVTGEMFLAEKGYGAYLNNRRIRVSNRINLSESLVATGIHLRGCSEGQAEKSIANLKKLGPHVASTRGFGATSLDLAYVAAGRFDAAWFSHFQHWDIAAGVLLVCESGGMVSDFTGGSDYLKNSEIIASNGKVHDQITSIL